MEQIVVVDKFTFSELPKKAIYIVDDFFKDSIKDENLKIIYVKGGESLKEWDELYKILEKLFLLNADRDTTLVAIGGGTVLDFVGLTAGLFMRGIDHIFIPTTLLAMADASVGGKCAINFLDRKNQVGIFKQAQKIILDFNFLDTLQRQQLSDGLVEILKIFLLLDKDYAYDLIDNILKGKDIDYKRIVNRAIDLKKEVTRKDMLDKGIRNILNFGHTIGHAIESYFNYKLSHGMCVLLGMINETKFFKNLEVSKLLEEIFVKLYFDNPNNIDFNNKELEKFILNDKKKINDEVMMVDLINIGCFKQKMVRLEDLCR